MVGAELLAEAGMEFYRGKGCTTCNNTGYKGRMAVHEIAIVDGEMRGLIHRGASLEEMFESAKKRGMMPIKDGAMELVKRGLSTLDEVSSLSIEE
jgi:type IV pilus assembly protein PilB